MKAKSKTIKTPIGLLKYPMNPGFTQILDNCKSDEDLFKLVEKNGFINPDAFTELNARGLYFEYKKWKNQN